MDPLTTTLALAVLAVLVVVAASALGERLGVAAPLLLVGAGVGASLVPGFPAVEVEPADGLRRERGVQTSGLCELPSLREHVG